MSRWLLVAVGGALLAAAGRVRAEAPDLGTDAERAAGKKLYDKFCGQCHGDSGGGDGVAAANLDPAPRVFTSGKFKIRSTPSGALPTTTDLKNIIRRGMPYTTMPAWPEFTDEELADLAYHIKTFSPDFAKPDFNVAPVALPGAPAYSKDASEAGRRLYEETGCISCHGQLGRGDGPSAGTLADDTGRPIRPADFTQRWTFRGGPTREDIFRTLTTGLNGTPMPAFGDALSEQQRWALTDYIYALGDGDDPRYASLLLVRHVDEKIDLAKGAEPFAAAPVARFPIVGQVMEPGRRFHSPIASIRVQGIYDGEDVAFLLRWNDMSAQTSGTNGPALPVSLADERADSVGAEPGTPAGAAAAEDDLWGESPAAAAVPSGSEFSDAVAIQIPSQKPAEARKPYFLFGDEANPVDLWFMDLAKQQAETFTGRGSGAVAPADAGDLGATARYDQGEWSVVMKRALRPTSGMSFEPGEFVPISFSVWDGFSRERGNRRGLTLWLHAYVEPERVETATVPMLRAGLGLLALEILVVAWVRRRQRSAGKVTAVSSPISSSSSS